MEGDQAWAGQEGELVDHTERRCHRRPQTCLFGQPLPPSAHHPHMHQPLVCLSISFPLSFHPPHLSVHLATHSLSVYPFTLGYPLLYHPSNLLSIHPFIHPSAHLPSAHPPTHQFTHTQLPIPLPTFYLPVHPTYPSIHLLPLVPLAHPAIKKAPAIQPSPLTSLFRSLPPGYTHFLVIHLSHPC